MAGKTMRPQMSARAAVALPGVVSVGVACGRPRITGPTFRPTGH